MKIIITILFFLANGTAFAELWIVGEWDCPAETKQNEMFILSTIDKEVYFEDGTSKSYLVYNYDFHKKGKLKVDMSLRSIWNIKDSFLHEEISYVDYQIIQNTLNLSEDMVKGFIADIHKVGEISRWEIVKNTSDILVYRSPGQNKNYQCNKES